ncbi:MAG: hypothetical protein AAFO82_12605 [Bacteroidota bacterium]
MGLFDRIFQKAKEPSEEPVIRFGRYSDSYKEDENYEAWNAAIESFTEGNYLDSYRHFFQYLRDEEEDNVHFKEENGKLYFEFFQGSKRVWGEANLLKFKAEAKIAHTEDFNVRFLRRLLEQNFGLKYSRFALDEDNNICIVFDTYTLDGSPYKLYYALKELAVNADKQDDLLLDEFKHLLDAVEDKHIQPIEETEKEIKHSFIIRKIEELLQAIEQSPLSPKEYPGAISYLLLSLTYKLDYLIKPEGYMMEALERIHRKYFAKDDFSNVEKNEYLQEEFRKLLERSKEDYFRELYFTTATFGITSPENHNRVANFIQMELRNMDWYYENHYLQIATAIPNYIVGYCMFNYAVPKPDRQLFQLYYRITESHFFRELGFQTIFYDQTTKQFDRKAIRRAIDEIRLKNADQYPHFRPVLGQLNYDNLAAFSRSYLEMIQDLDLSRRIG